MLKKTKMYWSYLLRQYNKRRIPDQNVNWSVLGIIFIPILIFIGFVYFASFFEEFDIAYDRIYFNIKDCISIHYIKWLVPFYTTNVYALLVGVVFIWFYIFFKECYLRREIYILLYIAFLIYVFLQIYPLAEYIPMIIWLTSSILILWNLNYKHLTIIVIISTFTYISFLLGKSDAKKVKENRATFDIVLKENDTILKENDTKKYFIYKTTEFIFIMDEIENDNGKVVIKPISNVETIAFNIKND